MEKKPKKTPFHKKLGGKKDKAYVARRLKAEGLSLRRIAELMEYKSHRSVQVLLEVETEEPDHRFRNLAFAVCVVIVVVFIIYLLIGFSS